MTMSPAPDRNSVTLDDLIEAYLRFKEWMDYDAERSAYSALEIAVMQKLFGTSYIAVPDALSAAGYGAMLSAMEQRMALIGRYIDAIHASVDGDDDDPEDTTLLREELDRTTFLSSVPWFITLHQAIHDAASSVRVGASGDASGYTIDESPFDDWLDEASDDEVASIRAFIIEDHPGIDALRFPRAALYELGLPQQAPEPIDYGPAALH